MKNVESIRKDRPLSDQELIALGDLYDEIDKNYKNIQSIAVDTVVWRAIEAKYVKNPKDAADQVFAAHPGMRGANGRYSQPGEIAIYTSLGEDKTAWNTVLEELRDVADQDLVLASRQVKLDRVLDLTDANVRQALGITHKQIVEDEDYKLTHALGNLARKHGFEGIIAPSAQDNNGKNLIIFKD